MSADATNLFADVVLGQEGAELGNAGSAAAEL